MHRLDLVLDPGWGRSPSRPVRGRVTGIGAELKVRGRWSTIVTVGVREGLLPRSCRGSGSIAVDVLVVKLL